MPTPDSPQSFPSAPCLIIPQIYLTPFPPQHIRGYPNSYTLTCSLSCSTCCSDILSSYIIRHLNMGPNRNQYADTCCSPRRIIPILTRRLYLTFTPHLYLGTIERFFRLRKCIKAHLNVSNYLLFLPHLNMGLGSRLQSTRRESLSPRNLLFITTP